MVKKFDPALQLSTDGFAALSVSEKEAYIKQRGCAAPLKPAQPDLSLMRYDGLLTVSDITGEDVFEGDLHGEDDAWAEGSPIDCDLDTIRQDLERFVEEVQEAIDAYRDELVEWEEALDDIFEDLDEPGREDLDQLDDATRLLADAERLEKEAAERQRKVAELRKQAAQLKG